MAVPDINFRARNVKTGRYTCKGGGCDVFCSRHRGRPGLAGRAGYFLLSSKYGDLYITGIEWFVDEVFHQDKSSHEIQVKT